MDRLSPLASLLPLWMSRAGLSRADLARMVEVNPAQVTRWAAGTGLPSGRHLPLLCSALRLTAPESVLLYESAGVPLANELGLFG